MGLFVKAVKSVINKGISGVIYCAGFIHTCDSCAVCPSIEADTNASGQRL